MNILFTPSYDGVKLKSEKYPKLAKIIPKLNAAVSGGSALSISLLFLRQSEFLQRGYFRYDGTTILTWMMVLIFPIIALLYRTWAPKRTRLFIALMNLVIFSISIYLIYEYNNLISQGPYSPYIEAGYFLENTIILMIMITLFGISIFLANSLLIISPWLILIKDDKNSSSLRKENYEKEDYNMKILLGGIAEINSSKKKKWKYSIPIVQTWGGSLLVSLIYLWILENIGIGLILWIIYGSNLFFMFGMWWITRGIYLPNQIDKDNDLDKSDDDKNIETINKSKTINLRERYLNTYLYFTLLIAIIIIALVNKVSDLMVLIVIGAIFSIFFFLGVFRLVWDHSYKPLNRADFLAQKRYKNLKKSSWLFGFGGIMNGLMILLASMFYNLDIDRYKELNSDIRLFSIILLVFVVVSFLLTWYSPKIFIMLAWISLSAMFYLELLVSIEASTTNWYSDPQKILDGFPFLQSWSHALLAGIPIGTVFAIYFKFYQRYFYKIGQHGIHFEEQFLFYFMLLITGLSIGHDYRFGGPHTQDFIRNSLKIFEILEIIFFIILGITLLVFITILIKIHKDGKKKIRELNRTEEEKRSIEKREAEKALLNNERNVNKDIKNEEMMVLKKGGI